MLEDLKISILHSLLVVVQLESGGLQLSVFGLHLLLTLVDLLLHESSLLFDILLFVFDLHLFMLDIDLLLLQFLISFDLPLLKVNYSILKSFSLGLWRAFKSVQALFHFV
jgi:hypothetical protein